jgi:hypothetical protein
MQQLWFINNPLAQHVSAIILPIFKNARPYFTAYGFQHLMCWLESCEAGKQAVCTLCTRPASRLSIYNFVIYNFIVSRDSVDFITIRYRLEVPGMEFRWRRDFLLPSRWVGVPLSLPYNGYHVSFQEVMHPGRGVDHQSPFRAEVKEKVELYL